jgi:1,4-alpha-glucan branching enzyme
MPKTINSKSANKLEKSVPFEFYAPAAQEVRIAGTFNNWDASKNKLKKDKEGRWTANLKLKSGHYEYRYLVDGNWENDQRTVGCVPNAYGTWNCVIEVA